MVALHLVPIHRALGVRFHSVGWEGQYSLTPMFLDDNRWFTAGATAMMPREEAESMEDGESLVVGDVEITLQGDDLVIQNKGLPFGKCNLDGYLRALEKARLAASKTERWNAAIGIEDSAVPQGKVTL